MSPKKDDIPITNRVKKKPRKSSFPKRTLKKEEKRILKLIEDEMRMMREEASSVKEFQEQILKELDDHGSALACIREVIQTAIQQNNLNEQLLDLMLVMILNGS